MQDRWGKVKFVAVVDNQVGAVSYGEPGKKIDDGVLLQEDGGDRNQEGRNVEKNAPSPMLEQTSIPGGIPHGHGTHYVQRGTHIGVGVVAVKDGNKINENVVPGEYRGTQKLDSGIEVEEHQTGGVGQDNEIHQVLKGTPVGEKGVDMDADQIDEPE